MPYVNTLDELAEVLQAGQPALFPTDTVVGLGVSVGHCASPDVLFHLKGRPAGKPVAWLVADSDALDEYGTDVSPAARETVAAHWPGAFTAIVKASEAVPQAYRSHEGTIGLRVPASETVRELIRHVGFPLATTSANMSGELAPCRVDDVSPELLEVVFTLDLDECGSGAASTVVDFSRGASVILRA